MSQRVVTYKRSTVMLIFGMMSHHQWNIVMPEFSILQYDMVTVEKLDNTRENCPVTIQYCDVVSQRCDVTIHHVVSQFRILL